MENDILDKLFAIRQEEMEMTTDEEREYIDNNKLKDVTHEDLINEIEKIKDIPKEMKEALLEKLDKLLENRSRLSSYSCKKYYVAGINDIMSIILNRKYQN